MRTCKFSALVILTLAAIAASSQTVSVLYNFGMANGSPWNPADFITQGLDGNLYSAARGGIYGFGVLFKMTPEGKGAEIFNAQSDGLIIPTPRAFASAPTLGIDGNFYGTSPFGGHNDLGTVYKMTPGGALTVLHDFAVGADGRQPDAPPVQGMDGNFYGTTTQGGSAAGGTVYKISPSGTFTTLYSFSVYDSVASAPLIQATDGNFYGTTPAGGQGNNGFGYGTIFKLSPSGTFKILHNFDLSHGAAPYAPLTQGSDGNFYGTAEMTGTCCGLVFKITPGGKFSILYNFTNTSDGAAPISALVEGTDGNFYGTTATGGLGYGTIYRITPAGAFSVVHTFDGTDGVAARTLVQHTNGLFYGNTVEGGSSIAQGILFCQGIGCGTYFSLDVGLGPFVRLLPAVSAPGRQIIILGQGLTGTTNVSFNGTPATFKVVSDTYLTAEVPSGVTTGPVTVSTTGGTLTSNQNFRVRP